MPSTIIYDSEVEQPANTVKVRTKLEKFRPHTSYNEVNPRYDFPFTTSKYLTPRFVYYTNDNRIMIYTAATDNWDAKKKGTAPLKAGWAVSFGEGVHGIYFSRLEQCGPNGPSSQGRKTRANLRALVGALQLCIWWKEPWEEVAIATENEAVYKGATNSLRVWQERGWTGSNNYPLYDKDLWKKLLQLGLDLCNNGTRVRVYKIPHMFNPKEVHQAARDALDLPDRMNWTEIEHTGLPSPSLIDGPVAESLDELKNETDNNQ